MPATVTRIVPDLLKDRIDATFYRSEFVANEERLKRSAVGVARLNSLVKSGRRAVYFSTNTLEKGAIAPFPEFGLLRNWHFAKVNQWLMKSSSRCRLIGNDQFSSHLHANH